MQTGELLPTVGAIGVGFMVTETVPATLVQPATVAVTLYVPDANTVAPAMLGFWIADEKLFGPIQLYVAPAITLAVKFKVFPSQIGELLPAVGAKGVEVTVTEVVPIKLVQPATVAVTLYVPDASTVAPAMLGFWITDEKLFGPVQL